MRSARCSARLLAAVALVLLAAGCASAPAPAPAARPNILFAIADDWSNPHAGVYGDPVVRTPAFDRVARAGVLFENAFVAAPSCTPSRGAILAGQDIWRLGEGGNLWSDLPQNIPIYTDLLAEAGYFVGLERKGWGPGRADAEAGRPYNPAGPAFKSFDDFLAARPSDAPFCYWFGSHDPHRPYEAGSGAAAGLSPAGVRVPPYLPDAPEVRSDLLDYYFEVERFDAELGRMLDLLEARGELANTLVVVTGDNGLPFPRAKANLYDSGARVPLAVMWASQIRGGRRVTDLVNLKDLAPTFLEAARLPVPGVMTGRSLAPLLRSGRSGRVEPARSAVYTGRERHAWVRAEGLGYPARAVRTDDYLYILNLEPERWPAGDPSTGAAASASAAEGYGDVDASPTKTFMLRRRDAYPRLFEAAFAKRPAEELYVLADDPHQMRNVAAEPRYAALRARLRADLEAHLRASGDPRFAGGPVAYDTFPFYGPRRAPSPRP